MGTLYILGDSTAAKKDDGARPETGWGECFSPYLKKGWSLVNAAVNGRSTRLVLSNGDFFSVLSKTERGDAVLIEYGHNESKSDEERHTEPWTSFKDNLSFMASSLLNKGVDVYFLTPITRRSFINGHLQDTHGDYPKAMRECAKELGIPLVDMLSATMKEVEDAGEDGSKKYFMNFGPGLYPNFADGKSDDTHLRPEGAALVAKTARDLLKPFNPSFLA